MYHKFLKKADSWFFLLFLIAIPFSIRKVFPLVLIRSEFNEYTTASVYLSDIFLALTMISWWVIILNNKTLNLSRYSLKELAKKAWLSPVFWLALFVIWSFLSIAWSTNTQIALYRSIKISEFSLLFLYIRYRLSSILFSADNHCDNQNCSTWNNFHVKTIFQRIGNNWLLLSKFKLFHHASGRVGVEHFANKLVFLAKSYLEKFCYLITNSYLKLLLVVIIASGVFQSLVGLIQFIAKHSIGLFWLKESLISVNNAGVAKLVLFGETFVRAYGTLPHPNILGGFLLFSIVATLTYKKLFHVEQLAFELLILVQVVSLLLSFSKSAILGLILFLAISSIQSIKELFHRAKGRVGVEHYLSFKPISNIKKVYSYLVKAKLFHRASGRAGVEQLVGIIVILLVILVFFGKIDRFSFIEKTWVERGFYLNVPRGTFREHPMVGLGNGQSVINIERYSPVNPQDWQFQPVHNVWLAIFSELGLVGLGLFVSFIFSLTKNCSTAPVGGQAWSNSKVSKYVVGLFWALIFISMFDHYLWDIQTGSLIWWMVLAIV